MRKQKELVVNIRGKLAANLACLLYMLQIRDRNAGEGEEEQRAKSLPICLIGDDNEGPIDGLNNVLFISGGKLRMS